MDGAPAFGAGSGSVVVPSQQMRLPGTHPGQDASLESRIANPNSSGFPTRASQFNEANRASVFPHQAREKSPFNSQQATVAEDGEDEEDDEEEDSADFDELYQVLDAIGRRLSTGLEKLEARVQQQEEQLKVIQQGIQFVSNQITALRR